MSLLMRVYQCIHIYQPHIPLFEKKYGIQGDTDITFEALRRLVIDDGYAGAYILSPALRHQSEEVFFTLWNYERLQHLWAREHGLRTTNLDEIKKAQIEQLKPDVFYNMSPIYDGDFICDLFPRSEHIKYVCWNGVIEQRPKTFPLYDAHLTLFKPFVDFWKRLGLRAFELQPGVVPAWLTVNSPRDIDVLFYGQFAESLFLKRAALLEQMAAYTRSSRHNIRLHLQYEPMKRRYATLGPLNIERTVFPSRRVRAVSHAPLYGAALSEAIGRSKIVINSFGDFNTAYKSNMRLFEAIGHGAFLISEEGCYPPGFEPGVDFYTFTDFGSLKEKIEYVLANWPEHEAIAQRTREKIGRLYSKEAQWQQFQACIRAL
jgi:hypothetical protein